MSYIAGVREGEGEGEGGRVRGRGGGGGKGSCPRQEKLNVLFFFFLHSVLMGYFL